MFLLLNAFASLASWPLSAVTRVLDEADEVWDLDDPLLTGD